MIRKSKKHAFGNMFKDTATIRKHNIEVQNKVHVVDGMAAASS
jgi:hypothetical protein